MLKAIVLLVGAVMLAAAVPLGFYFGIRFPQRHEVTSIIRWLGLAGGALLLVSLAIDRKKSK